MLYSAKADQKRLAGLDDLPADSELIQAREIAEEMDGWKKDLSAVKQMTTNTSGQEELYYGSYSYRDFWPSVLNLICGSIEQVAVDQPKLGDTEAEREKSIEAVQAKPRNQRRMITMISFEPAYVADISKVSLGGEPRPSTPPPTGRPLRGNNTLNRSEAPKVQRGYSITVTVRMPLGSEDALGLVGDLLKRVDANAEKYDSLKVLDHAFKSLGATSGGEVNTSRYGTGFPDMAPSFPGGPSMPPPSRTTEPKVKAEKPDPMFPNDPKEDMSGDSTFQLQWLIAIAGNGLEKNDKDNSNLSGDHMGGR